MNGPINPAVANAAAAENTTRPIGDLIREALDLGPDAIERVVEFQRENNVRFGEAAIALGLANTEDVLYALSQQFKYAYADEERRKLSPELVALNQPFGHQAEAFRAVRSQILLRTQSHQASGATGTVLAVVSVDSGDGKSYFCANLAVSMSQLGGRVLIVDCDMRGARQHQIFGVDNTRGITNLLSGRDGKKLIKPAPGIPNLWVLPLGVQPPNPLELVEGPGFGMLLRQLTAKFDHVILDTPAAVFGTDSVVISARTGHALIIARKGANKVARLQELVASLGVAQVRMAGVVMNEF